MKTKEDLREEFKSVKEKYLDRKTTGEILHHLGFTVRGDRVSLDGHPRDLDSQIYDNGSVFDFKNDRCVDIFEIIAENSNYTPVEALDYVKRLIGVHS